MGGMKDLLGGQAYVPVAHARNTDPVTSHQAAATVSKKLTDLQVQVRVELGAAGRAVLTDFELESLCGSHGSTFRTRRAELVERGLVVDSGRKKLINGSNRIIWVAVEFADKVPA